MLAAEALGEDERAAEEPHDALGAEAHDVEGARRGRVRPGDGARAVLQEDDVLILERRAGADDDDVGTGAATPAFLAPDAPSIGPDEPSMALTVAVLSEDAFSTWLHLLGEPQPHSHAVDRLITDPVLRPCAQQWLRTGFSQTLCTAVAAHGVRSTLCTGWRHTGLHRVAMS